MVAICISAGNTDNKLTQLEWSELVRDLSFAISDYEVARHFFGGSETYAPWQNVCWICTIEEQNIQELKNTIGKIRALYRQDSVFVLYGAGDFV